MENETNRRTGTPFCHAATRSTEDRLDIFRNYPHSPMILEQFFCHALYFRGIETLVPEKKCVMPKNPFVDFHAAIHGWFLQ